MYHARSTVVWCSRDSSPTNENLLNTNEDVLKNVGNQTAFGPHWLSIFPYYGSQWGPAAIWFPTFFKVCSFMFNLRKKLMPVWSNVKVSKWWQNFHLWVNYSFNVGLRSFWSLKMMDHIDFFAQKQLKYSSNIFLSVLQIDMNQSEFEGIKIITVFNSTARWQKWLTNLFGKVKTIVIYIYIYILNRFTAQIIHIF